MATAPDQIGPTRRVHPALLILLAIVAVGALVVLVILPLLSPDTVEEPIITTPTTPAPTTPAPRTPATASPPPETFEVFESKDPFRPLVVAGGGGGAAAGAPATGGTTTGTNGTTSVGAAGASAPTGGQRVAVLDVFDDQGTTKVQVKVGGTVFTVTAGQTFASNYKLVSVSGSCATLLRGDDKFTLCEGEEVIK